MYSDEHFSDSTLSPLTLHLCGGPSLCWEYTSFFLLLWPPPSLIDSSSSSQGPRVSMTCPDSTAQSCTPLLWAPLGAVLTVSVHCLPSFLVANSLLQHVHEPLEGTGCVFLWGAWPRTCDYECLLNECSNPVWLMQNVWKCDIKPPFTWKIEVVMQCVILVLGNPECAQCSISMRWGMVYLCVHSLERGHSHMALNPCLVCWCFL